VLDGVPLWRTLPQARHPAVAHVKPRSRSFDLGFRVLTNRLRLSSADLRIFNHAIFSSKSCFQSWTSSGASFGILTPMLEGNTSEARGIRIGDRAGGIAFRIGRCVYRYSCSLTLLRENKSRCSFRLKRVEALFQIFQIQMKADRDPQRESVATNWSGNGAHLRLETASLRPDAAQFQQMLSIQIESVNGCVQAPIANGFQATETGFTLRLSQHSRASSHFTGYEPHPGLARFCEWEYPRTWSGRLNRTGGGFDWGGASAQHARQGARTPSFQGTLADYG